MTDQERKRLNSAAPKLLKFAEAYLALFRNSDMRPEDECHELYAMAEKAVALAKGGK